MLVESGAPFCAQTLTLGHLLAPVAFDWVEFIAVRRGVCQVTRSECGHPDLARVGDVVFLMPSVPWGVEPAGEVTLTRLFLAVPFMTDIIRWRNPQLRLDQMTAPLFAETRCPGPSQFFHVKQSEQETLFTSLDTLDRLTSEQRILADFYQAGTCAFRALDVLVAHLARGRHSPSPDPATLTCRASQACCSALLPLSPAVRIAPTTIKTRFNQPLPLRELAQEAHVSVAQLKRDFAAQMGKSPRAYRDSLRVQKWSGFG
jgi:hypothetical protein